MRARLLALMALALFGAAAYAQEAELPSEPFQPYFSLEFGTGIAPIHTLVNRAGLRWDDEIADQGLEPVSDAGWCPAFSLSAAWHTSLKWEFAVTGGVSWCHYKVVQYRIFGTDPQGKPRYNLEDPQGTFWTSSAPALALFLQGRRFWNPTQKVKLYSAAGFGFYTDGKTFQPVPALTPIAVRFGTGPLKFFIENTFSPAATSWQIGVGYTF